MTDNVKSLISAVADGDMSRAKKAAVAVCVSDTTKKDILFCRRTIDKLQNEPEMTKLQLPSNISKYASLEDVSHSFVKERYFLSEREKQLFTEIVNADKVGGKLAEKRIRHLNATLLYGESGTGKTTFGRYVAYEFGLPFLYLNFSFLISSLLGQTGQNIHHVFEFAKQQRCVFMLDELDAIGGERSSGNHDVPEISRIVITLMQELDTLGNDIIVLAATNRYDIIDRAIKRRFTRNHEIKRLLPDERILFGMKYLSDCGYTVTENDVVNIIGQAEKQSDIENEIINYIIYKEMEQINTV